MNDDGDGVIAAHKVEAGFVGLCGPRPPEGRRDLMQGIRGRDRQHCMRRCPAMTAKRLLFGEDARDKAHRACAGHSLEALCLRARMRAPVRPVAAAGASLWSAAFLPLLPFMLPVFVGFFALGLALPVVPRYVHDILGQGIAILKLRGGAIASSLAGANLGQARFDIDTIRKDLRTMADEAQAMGARLPTAQAALVALDAAAADGLGNSDGAELAAWTLGRLPRP